MALAFVFGGRGVCASRPLLPESLYTQNFQLEKGQSVHQQKGPEPQQNN